MITPPESISLSFARGYTRIFWSLSLSRSNAAHTSDVSSFASGSLYCMIADRNSVNA
jgi:hypothetical protein